ncbi:CCR4-Not complex component, Not1-domain-containing protein [Mucor mucedo]|uniref:CCR4-Not complex component, Not1-domain-containing protein n=1 Tax=Mucor mucedo TaxID=29922 RepID=UPI00221EE274|nr:CCR4-Not complex component, Not1-domain-containing protein [Mucor mucedo]KAI7871980.1 CCR4-Not complex component, Not1-domain-containing protein [Mucor mucedo]
MLIELDRLLKQSGNLPFSLLPPHHDIILVMRQIPLLINQSAQTTLLRSVVEKVVFQLYQSTTGLSIEVYCRFLQTLIELSPSISKETLSWILYSEDERKYNVWIVTSLVKFGLIPLEEYDIQLAKQLNKEHPDSHLIDFTTGLLQNCLLTMHPITSIEDHVLVINALKRSQSPKAEELIQDLKNSMIQSYKNCDSYSDSFTLRLLLAEWTRVCRHSMTSTAIYTQFAERILQTTTCDTERLCFFFRLCTEICIDLYQPSRPQSIDAYTKLVGYMIRIQDNYTSKITMATHVLSVAVLVLAHQHETLNTQFNQKPFLKLLSSLFIELNQSTSNDKNTNTSFITVYSDTLYTLEPRHFSGFAFSWLQLFSHRLYLPLLLSQENQPNGWTICFKLMSAHLSFLKTLLQQKSQHQRRLLGPSEKAFYQGTLRFLVVMLHDYPEFLCEHYLSFIQLLPPDCIQLRNVILSSFPRDMILPDPFTTTLGYMATTSHPPRLFIDEYTYDTLGENRKDIFQLKDLDDYLAIGNSTSFVTNGVISYIMDDKNTFDPEKIQQLIFYVGTKAKLATTKPLSDNPAIQIYKHLLSHMPTSYEKYLLINSIVDHLRYPNSHTYFFSMALLHLFSTQTELIKELITR